MGELDGFVAKGRREVFKPAKRGDRITCAYLYQGGQLEVVFERDLRDVSAKVTYVHLLEDCGLHLPISLSRVYFDGYAGVSMLRMAFEAGAHGVDWYADNSSPSAKERRVLVQTLQLYTPLGTMEFHMLPDLQGMSAEATERGSNRHGMGDHAWEACTMDRLWLGRRWRGDATLGKVLCTTPDGAGFAKEPQRPVRPTEYSLT